MWIASQKYYFGLGGGTQALMDIIKEMKLPLEVTIVKTVGLESVKQGCVVFEEGRFHRVIDRIILLFVNRGC